MLKCHRPSCPDLFDAPAFEAYCRSFDLLLVAVYTLLELTSSNTLVWKGIYI